MAIKIVLALLSALTCAAPLTAAAQNFPERPLRFIIPNAPGGGMDAIAHVMVQKLTYEFGKNVIIDHRPGGGGNIGVELANQATPDGHTLLMISTTAVIHPLMYKARYDLHRDFVAVSQLVNQPYLLVVTSSLPVTSVTELVSYAKSNPGKLSYASAGNGTLTHLAVELLKMQAGIEMVHVPYKGMGAAYPDMIAGRVQLGFWSIVSVQQHVRAKRLQALAVSGAQRAKSAPEVPTVAEAGVPGFAVTQWYGVLVPAATPRAIVDRLNRVIVTVLRDPDVGARVTTDGAEPVGSSPRQFEAHLKTEHDKWSRVIKQTGIRDK